MREQVPANVILLPVMVGCIVLSSCTQPAEKASSKAAPISIEDWDGIAYRSQLGFCGFVGQVEKALWVPKGQPRTNTSQFHGVKAAGDSEDLAIRVRRILWKNEGERKPKGRYQIFMRKLFKEKPDVVNFAWMKPGELLEYTIYGSAGGPEFPDRLPYRSLKVGKTYLLVTTYRFFYGAYFLANCAKEIPAGRELR